MTKKIEAILGEALIKRGFVSKEDWDAVLQEAVVSSQSLVALLEAKGKLAEKQTLKILAEELGLEFVELKKISVDKHLIDRIPIRIAVYYQFVPVSMQERALTIAVAFPLDTKTQDEIRTHLGYSINIALSAKDDILDALKRIYGVGAETLDKITTVSGSSPAPVQMGQEKVEDIEALVEDASVINLVNEIIFEAYKRRATDIHIEPYRDDVSIRYRIDGVLYDVPASGQIKDFLSAIISRIKIMCNLNIVERRLPQDGRAIVKTHEQPLDLRISTLPTPYGESIAIRLLPTKMLFSMEKLGLEGKDLEMFEDLIRKPHGIIFVTGPTGSGKSTTLYACLTRINTRDRKIITLEDPIEYDIKGVTQIQVQPDIGLDFARGLRSILRHDPDVIMVGEVRDLETAEIANRVALTGHLIFSTLHTNDAASGITRLVDIGIEPYLIASSVEAFIAQRLVRVICAHCKQEDLSAQESLRQDISKVLGPSFKGKVKIFRGQGCDKCNGTGFFGRTAIYEVLLVDEVIKDLIIEKVSSGQIKREAIGRGMRTLVQDGWQKVIKGVTTPEEVLRVISVEGEGSQDSSSVALPLKPLAVQAAEESPKSGQDNRAFARVDNTVGVRYKIVDPSSDKVHKAQEKSCMTSSLSAGGISFISEEALSLGSIIEVELVLPDGKKPVKCLGKVAWSRVTKSGDHECGLCFLDLTGGERSRLSHYVKSQ